MRYNAQKKEPTMKWIFAIFWASIEVFAAIAPFDTFQADFVQTVTDDTNKTITYRGDITALRPATARWHYTEPVEKTVFISGHTVTVVEPELEQAIVKEFRNDIDFFRMLSRAEPLGKNRYLAAYGKRRFVIETEKDLPVSITYKDDFDNRIRIVFSHRKIDVPLDPKSLEPKIPDDYDLLRE